MYPIRKTLLALALGLAATAAQPAIAQNCTEPAVKLDLRRTVNGAFVGAVNGDLQGSLVITPLITVTNESLVPNPEPPKYEVLYVARGAESTLRAIISATDVAIAKNKVDRNGGGDLIEATGELEKTTGYLHIDSVVNVTRGVQKGAAYFTLCS